MTITHSSFRIEMDEVVSEINRLSNNMFIETYVKVPDISVIRLQLLNLSLYHASVPKTHRILYCVTTGLVQMALDLHETITNEKEFQEKGIRNRQLSILAGDYYSSKYYSLLSKNNLTDIVKKLALGIRNINIAKMKLYERNTGQTSIDYFSELIKQRDSNLYVQFMDLLKSENHKKFWNSLIENMIFLFSLAGEMQAKFITKQDYIYYLVNYYANSDEKRDLQETNSNSDMNTKIKTLYHKYGIQSKIEETIHDMYTNLTEKINGMENRIIHGELSYLLHQFANSFQIFNKAVEKI